MNPQDSYVHTNFEPGSFWDRRRKVVQSNTLPFQLDMLRQTGRYDAFDLKWHKCYSDPPTFWPVPNHLFWDSDVAKWIEGVSYLSEKGAEDKTKEDMSPAVKDLVSKIRKAQQPDGYLNIHFTVVEPDKRFSNLRDLHELYNAGHLIEAALAHEGHYKSDELMEPIRRYVHLLSSTFGPGSGQLHGYPGHPEIELALLRLYKRTKDKEYLDLARYFILERGNPKGQEGQHYYDWEAKTRGEGEHERPDYYPARRSYWYNQTHKPILEQATIEGHSVRAMYLLTAVADLALIDQEKFRPQYESSLHRLWENMVYQKMYLTGGIGAMKQWEGFGVDYFLPQSSDEGGCYSETCAAIGVMMLAERLLQLELNGEYGDILERCLYNAMLTGMSIDGKAFTYVNQLASSEGYPSKREEWFECACCPPNVARVLGHIGGYLWTATTTSPNSVDVNVHLYASATLDYTLEDGGNSSKSIRLKQSTDYPWESDIKFSLTPDADIQTTIRLRIPAWATESYSLSPKPSSSSSLEKGYLTLPPTYLASHPSFTLSFGPLRPRLIQPHPFTNQNIVALARGPIIYCLEDVDNEWVDDHFKSLVLLSSAISSLKFKEKQKSDLPGGETYVAITAEKAGHFLKKQELEKKGLDFVGTKEIVDSEKEAKDLIFVPYFARANRVVGDRKGEMMRVGIRVA